MNVQEIEKGLKALQKAVEDGAGNRRDVLLLKAQKNELTADEKGELMKSLEGATLATNVTSGLAQNAAITKSLEGTDATDFLREFLKGNVDGFRKLSDAIEKGETGEHGFRKALAQTLVGEHALLKSIDERLGELIDLVKAAPAVTTAPVVADPVRKSTVTVIGSNGSTVELPAIGGEARGPRAVVPQGQAQPINKAFVGNGGAPVAEGGMTDPEEISKALIEYAEHLVAKGGGEGSMTGSNGDLGVTARNGEAISVAVSTLEQRGYITKSLLDEVNGWRKSVTA